jgi:hypothetical protein
MPARKTMKDCHLNIFYSEADSGHIADIPDLESSSAYGKTPTESAQASRSRVTLRALRVETDYEMLMARVRVKVGCPAAYEQARRRALAQPT